MRLVTIRFGTASFADAQPGQARWAENPKTGQVASLMYVCPCGCARIGVVPVGTIEGVSPTHSWDGDPVMPTISPSLPPVRACPSRWRGTLTNGMFIAS